MGLTKDKHTNFKNKKILVTGGSGLIGSNLIEELLNQEAFVRTPRHIKKIPFDHKNLEILNGDLRDKDFCREITKDIEYVFCCATETSSSIIIRKDPLKYITSNTIMDILLLESAILNKVKKLLFISSSIVYPDKDKFMKEEDISNENCNDNFWAAIETKLYIEKLCKFYHNNFDIDISIVRPSNVYGIRGNFDSVSAQVLPSFINKVYNADKIINIDCNENVIRDFIYVKDLVNGLLLSIEKYTCGQPINIGSGNPITLKFLIENIINIMGKHIEVKFNNKKTLFKNRKMNIDLAKKKIGFKSEYSLEKGLKETIEWYINNIKDKKNGKTCY